MIRRLIVMAGFIAGACVAGRATAQVVVYDNGAPDPGYLSEYAYNLTDTVQAEDFTLAAPATVTGLRFYALDLHNGYAGSIDWSIRPDDGGRPAATALAGDLASDVAVTPTGITRDDYHNASLSLYSIDTDPVELAPGRW